jgi:hypothetical protein
MFSRWWPRLTVVWPKSIQLTCSLGLITPAENLGRHTGFSNTIDNMKTKIDNMKAKIQDEEDRGPLSRPSQARRQIPEQLGASPTSSPLEGPLPSSLRLARQVSTSHDKFAPRMTGRLFARAVPVSDWGVGHDTGRDPKTQTSSPRRVGDRFPAPCEHTSRQLVRAAGPDMSLNTTLPDCVSITSPSSLTLQHANSARGTQAPPTTSSGLRLGLNVES